MTVAHDQDSLCADAPIGRFGQTYLSLDMDFFHRSSKEWRGPVTVVDGSWRMSGIFLELAIQVRVRRFWRRRRPQRWITGFGWFDTTESPWPRDRFVARPGVEVADLLRLAELSRAYHRNLLINPQHDVVRARFIPSADENALRAIGARLRQPNGM